MATIPRDQWPGAEGRKHVLANTAMLYYRDGLTQDAIARRLGVSRPTVLNYLRLARETGIVDIRIDGEAFSTSNLSRELSEKFGLSDVYIADYSPMAAAEDHISVMNRHVARVGAEAFFQIVRPGEMIGVAWGETVHHLAELLPHRPLDGIQVVQMIGSMESPFVSTAEACAILISSRLGASCHTLHAPAILSSVELAEQLRREPSIRNQLARLEQVDRVVFSVGDCDNNTHVVQAGIATRDDFAWYLKKGAVGVLCGRFIDAAGNHIHGDMDSRMIGVELDRLKGLHKGILVAGGPAKLKGIRATLHGGYVSHLVTDERTGRMLAKR